MSRDFVSPDYLLEASVVFVWMSTLMPWSVVYSPLSGAGFSALFIRYPIVEIRYVIGTNLPTQFYTPLSGYKLHAAGGDPMSLGYLVWGVGGVVFAVTFLLTIALFIRESTVHRVVPVPVPRAVGGLLIASGSLFVAATAVFVLKGFNGTPVPLGMAFMIGFGLVLLLNPTSDGQTADSAATPD